MVLRREEGADVALKDEVRLDRAFDGFLDVRIGGVDQRADLLADGLLPGREGLDVVVHARVIHAGSMPDIGNRRGNRMAAWAPLTIPWPLCLSPIAGAFNG